MKDAAVVSAAGKKAVWLLYASGIAVHLRTEQDVKNAVFLGAANLRSQDSTAVLRLATQGPLVNLDQGAEA